MTVVGHAPVVYEYDASDRVVRIGKVGVVVDISYDGVGRQSEVTFSNGNVVRHVYDHDSNIVSIVYANVSGEMGRIDYVHDALGRITSQTGSWARTIVPEARAFSYSQGNRLTHSSSYLLSYDDNGNLVSDGLRAYTWNARGQLTGIVTDGVTTEYRYDGVGRRLATVRNGVQHSYVYDGKNVALETADGAVATTFVSGAGVDDWLLREDASGINAILRDSNGNTIAIAGVPGTPTMTVSYELYGSPSVEPSSPQERILFTGREYDGHGLYYYRARYYSGSLHRFISEDLLEYEAGPNVFSYVTGDPLNSTDPFGLSPLDCVRAMWYERECASSGVRCAEEIQRRFNDDPVKTLEECGASGLSGAKIKKCFQENLDCQKYVQYSTECVAFPHGGMWQLVKQLLGW